ncbi:hypothetical protein [uncultured Desulfuromusa sp.]|uniref:hypothetical protein n=1 Tax=uncultured Desulfuromusa sp. TaxID=219183 RepID=UPI002AA7C882|nr:hypothetical protein [uncultured Desulfuromusa sp.]
MTDNEKLQKLLKEVDETDRMELDILQAAVTSTRSAYQSEATANRKKDWDAAKEGLREELDRLWTSYMVQEERFENRKAALEYLNSNGYSVSQGKLYGHAKKGLLKLQADKSVLKSSLEAYIDNPASGLIRHGDVGPSEEDKAQSAEKLKYEVSILKTKDAKQKFDFEKEQGKYILKDEFEMEVSARAAVLDSGLSYWIKSNVAEWIQVCCGSQEKRSELMQLMLEGKDQRLNEFAATDRYQVMFVDVEDSE